MYVAVEPVVPLLVGRRGVPEGGVFHQLLNVGGIAIALEFIDESQHGHRHDVEEQSARRHPIVGIAHAHAALPKFHLAQSLHQIDEVTVAVRDIVYARVIIHQSGHQRTCRPLLDNPLFVGGGV